MKKRWKVIGFFAAFFIFVGVVFLRSHHLEEDNIKHPPLTVVFPDLHFDRNWDISDGSSLWSIFILNNITETLIRVGNNSDLTPALASGWAFSKDKKTLRFSLSNEYKFHNGKPITPKDVFQSLKRSFSSTKMKHSEIYKFLLSENLDESIRLNGNDLEIRLHSPLNALTYKFSIQEMGVAPQDYAKEKTHKESLHNLSGPYQVVDFTDHELKLKKHLGHPLVHKKSPDRVNIIKIPRIEKVVEHYRNHDNVILVGSGYANALKYINLDGEKHVSAFAFTEFFIPNIESKNLASKTKRRAAFSAIKKAFGRIKIDERVAQKTHQLFTKNNLARLKSNKLSDIYDEAPHDTPKKLSVLLFDFMKETPILAPLKKELKGLGIELEIINQDTQEFSQRLEKKDYDLFYVYSGVTALDPIVELIYLFNHRISNFNHKNKPLVTLLEKAKREIDRKHYISFLKEIHLGLLKEYRMLPLMHTRMVYSSKGIYQLKELSYFDGSFNLWDWHRK